MQPIDSEFLYQYVGTEIRRLRMGKSMTQAVLAKNVGMSRVTIVNIENGRQHPTLHLLMAISTVLGVELRDLMPLLRQTPSKDTIDELQSVYMVHTLSERNISKIATLYERAVSNNEGGTSEKDPQG